MSPPVGYRPDRIATLDRRTRDAIADLRAMRCTDSAAAPAMRTIFLTAQTLEEHWMPLIMAIRASDAMTSWTQSALQQIDGLGTQLDGWFSFVGERETSISFAHLSDDELLRHVYLASDFSVTLTGKTFAELVASDDQFWSEDFPAYADELAARVAADPDFASLAATSAASAPLIAFATRYADFDDSFVLDLARQMFHEPKWRRPVYTAGAQAVVDQVVARGAGTALDALLHPPFSLAILGRSPLADELVESVLVSGLYEAVLADSSRLVDGAQALKVIVQHTNGPLDSGMRSAGAGALAFTMRGYLPHIAPGVKMEHNDAPVRLVDADGRRVLELGTYPEVSNLFGSMMRDRDAQLLVGAALGIYTDELINELGADVATGTGLSAVGHFGDLLRESLSAEQLEMVAAAAAAAERRKRAGDVLGFGVKVAVTATGVGSVAKALSDRGIKELTARLSTVDPANMPNTSLQQATYDNITLSVVTMLVMTPSVRRELGADSVTDEQWGRIATDLDAIDRLAPGPERDTAIFDLEQHIAADVAEVDAVLGDVRAREGIGQLTEATD